MSGIVKPSAYGSSTITEDKAPTIQLTPTPKEKVIELLVFMNESLLFPPAALEKMEKWIAESLDVYFDDLSPDEAKLEAGKVLSYLLIDVIDPMFNDQTPEDILDQILDIRDEFVKVLKMVLPKGADAKAFIKERKFNHQKIQLFVNKIFIETACTQVSEAQLYSTGEELNQKNTSNYETLKNALAKFKLKRDGFVIMAKEALGENEKMLYQTSNDLANIADTAKIVSQEMLAAANTFEQQRQQCLNNAREVTKL